jgi:hypothetical protein
MIEIHLPTKPPSRIDYCPASNEVLLVHIGGRLLLDTNSGVVRKGWMKQLINFVVENEYNVESHGGTPVFVRGLASQGRLSIRK